MSFIGGGMRKFRTWDNVSHSIDSFHLRYKIFIYSNTSVRELYAGRLQV
jgi:hypothetical protein